MFFKHRKTAVVIVAGITLLGCAGNGFASKTAKPAVSNELRRLQQTTPAIEFDLNLKKGDLRFMGLRGFTLQVPGIVGAQFNSIVAAYKVRLIEGTSDSVESEEQVQAQDRAAEFAALYNRILLSYLVENKLELPKSAVE